MSEKDNIKKIQKSIEDILGTKSKLLKKRPSVKDKEREHFNVILNTLAYLNSRSIGLKHDYKVDFIEYEDPFFNIIESFMKLHFAKEQRSIINWWLYDKFLPSGDMLILNDNETHEEIPTETPEDIWDLLKELKLRDEKENPK